MDKDQRIVKLKLDVIFKRIFGDNSNKRIIAAFVSDLLELPRESVRSVSIENVEITPETLNQKFSRLDLKLDVDGRIVNVEMQVNNDKEFKERTLYYWSKLYSGELKAGGKYSDLKQTICVNIINFNLFDCEDYHSHFLLQEKNRQETLTDKLAIHFFELRKLGNFKKNRRIEDWLNLINAETEDELMTIEQTTTIPEVAETIVQLRQLSADEKIRQEAWYREKQLLDEASALDSAHRQGVEEGALNMLVRLVKSGALTVERGAKEADMTLSEFEKLLESDS